MSEIKYAKIKDVAAIAKKNYLETKERTDFVDIIYHLSKHQQLLSHLPVHRKINLPLSMEDFRNYVYQNYINATQLLDHEHNSSYISENAIAPETKDLFALIHLPYIKAEMHAHNYFEINYVYSGTCIQYFEQEKRIFKTGDLIIIAPESPHIVIVEDDSFVISFNIRTTTFDKVFWQLLNHNDLLSLFFTNALYEKNQPNYLSFHLDQPEPYEAQMQKIFCETFINDVYANSIATNLLHVFFGELLRAFGNHIHIFSSEIATNFNQDFPYILKYVQYNYNTVDLGILSKIFHYSEVYISKMFKKYLHQSFSSTVQILRLTHAKQYLEQTDYTIEQIANQIGYTSADHFTRIFKKKYKKTPSEYRKSVKFTSHQ